MFGRAKNDAPLPMGLAHTLEEITRRYRKREAIRYESQTITYQELEENSNRVATGLATLGIGKGDRVAIMLPNVPEFAYSLFGIQKLGGVAVPFNTMYKGREISFILKDSGAKAIICLTNFANLINEIKEECPDLEHVIVTGQRTLVFIDPDATVNVQMVFEKAQLPDPDEAFRAIGAVLVETFQELGVKDAWYKHQGAVRAGGGRKLATILLSEIENLYVSNIVAFLKEMDTEPLFKVLYVPPEVKDKALEPLTSVEQEAGETATLERFRDVLLEKLSRRLEITIKPGKLTRDELMAYEKNRALAHKV